MNAPKLSLKVLYVEDEALICTLTLKLLRKIVDEVIIAENGKIALQKFEEYKPDVVISDIAMPEMDGIELATNILQKNIDFPIIFLSAHQDEKYLLKAISIRAYGFIIKPVELVPLYKQLEKLDKEIQLKREIEKQIIRTRTILDFLQNMIIVTDGIRLLEANKSFLNFTGFYSIDDFHNKYNCIAQIFIEPTDLCNQNIIHWINEYTQTGHEFKVRLLDSNSQFEKVFLLRHSKFPDDEIYIISFTDITKLELETNELEHRASVDELTGIYNRKKFEELLTQEINQVLEKKISLSLIMFDLDLFKSINDTYGHDMGDKVLITVSGLIKKSIRSTDIFARWGGEEFMIVLPYTSSNGAYSIAEKIRTLVQEYQFPIERTVTLSLGVTQYIPYESKDVLFKRLDESLYKAKRSGRNNTVQQ